MRRTPKNLASDANDMHPANWSWIKKKAGERLDQLDAKMFAIWREKLWSTFVRLESTTDDDGFYGHVREAVAESNRLSFVHSTSQLTERTHAHIRADHQELVLMAVQTTGYGFVEQDGRQARLESGDFAIYETTRPYRLFFEKPFDQLIFRLPRVLLDRRLPNLSRQTARTFKGKSGAVAVAAGFALQLAENAHQLGDGGIASFEASAADLIATAIQLENSCIDGGDRVRFERLQTRLLRHVHGQIPDFEEVAASEGMSLRTFQRLFQIHGTTPTKWILEKRLEGVAEDLRIPALLGRSITEIAFSWGFNDLSHFNRAFRAKFGVSPKAFRH
jgi:AraC-like DNA-binding protein